MNRLRILVSSAVLAFTCAFGVSLAHGQLTPSADAYTNSANPTTNYGAAVLLDVGSSQTTYIQFNLSSIPSGYTSADITKATLKLYVNAVTTAGSFNVDYVNGAWVESTITHNLAPALGTTIVASFPLTTAEKNQYVLIDVTAAVQAWLSGTPNDGIALVGNSPVNASFDSKENASTSHAPELDIVFAGGGTIAGVTTAAGSGLIGGGTSGTLNLSLTNTCASGQVLEWNGTAWACTTPKGTGTVTKVASGAGLTGGPITGSGTLSIATGGVTNAMLADSYAQVGVANTFTGNQTVTGILTAGTSSSSTNGVLGEAQATSGQTYGVGGLAQSPSGYGVWGLNDATAGGAGVYGSSASAAGYGVEGINTSGGGTGVYGTAGHFGVQGIATATSGSTVGVYGAGVDGLQGSGTLHGVYAAGSGAGSLGVYGTAPAFGLYGVATATSGNSVGVFGAGIDGLQGSGSTYGVYAAGTGASATGVYATTGSTTGYGVEGVNASGDGTGVYGTAAHFGVQGIATGSGSTVGVFGSGVDGLQGAGTVHGVYSNGGQYGVLSYTSAGAAGTYGVYQGASATGTAGSWEFYYGTAYPHAGVWADTNFGAYSGPYWNQYFPALLATADDNMAGFVINNSDFAPTMSIVNLAGGTTITDIVRAEGSGGSCTLTGAGDTVCTGVLKSAVATAGGAGAQRVETYSVQSAENWFEDAGTAQLVNGTGRVNLESIFGQTVNTGVEYHVFLTPDGDCKGLYVSSKTASGFEVRELGGGASSIAFEYRIMAKRVGYENVRLANVTERFNKQQAQSQKMRRPARSSAEAQSGPRMPTLPSAVTPSAPQMPTLPAMPSALPRPEPVTPKLPPMPPVRTAAQPAAAQPK